jgi:GT2 family glycosyltransferase
VTEAAAAEIRYAFDGALDWPPEAPVRILEGWCFGVTATVRSIELRIDGRAHSAQYGLPRSDVAALFPDFAAAAESGFRIALPLSPGRHEVALVAVRDDAPALELLRRVLDVAFAPLQGYVESPGPAPIPAGTAKVSGWCFHPQAQLVHLWVRVGGRMHGCAYPLLRRDVARVYANLPPAEQSGFEVELDLPSGRHVLDLVGELDSGDTVTLAPAARIEVLSNRMPARTLRALRARAAGLREAAAMGRAWVAARGHLPRPREWPRLARKAWALASARGSTPHALPGGFEVPPVVDRYQAWLDLNRWNDRRAAWLASRLAASGPLPTLSVVMPVYRPDRDWFDRAVDTLRAQVHSHWELCIADDASGDPALTRHLEVLAARDPRIKVVHRKENGNISRATNSAAELATGDFLLFLDQDDELPPDALGEIALALAAAPDADILYTDDDKIDVDGRRYDPQFKPDFSPELLLSYMYFSHAFVVRRSLFTTQGGFREGFEGSQDYDFALRATEKARRVVHIPLVLYHWRATPGSTATSGAAKPESFERARRAIDEALERRGSAGRAAQPDWAARGGLGLFTHAFPDEGPSVAVLIPTKNHRATLARCLDSLAKTTYRNYEVVVIDNESDDPATCDYLARLPLRVLHVGNPGPQFSFAHVNNVAARAVDAEYLLFLNDDTEVIAPSWLSAMVGYVQLDGVGAVGARLVYPDGRVQHAGVLHGYYGGLPGPAFKLAPADEPGYLAYAAVARNYGAVTAACMLTPRRLFLEQGGFDGERFAVAYNDVDYGFRLEAGGLRCVYAPGATLLHHEGHSRGFVDNPHETAAYRTRYGRRIERWYNPNLSLAHERFAIQPVRSFVAAPPGPVRALMCGFNLNWEGASHSQFEMSSELKRRGVLDPIVFSPKDGPLRAAYEVEGIPVHVAEHPLSGVTASRDYEFALDSFCRWIRSLGVGLVYGNTLQTFYAIDAARRLGLPSVWNPRESEPWHSYFRQYPDALAIRALASYAFPYRVVFVAHATAAGSAEIDTRSNFAVVHNGIDRRRLVAAASDVDRAAARASLGIGPDDIAFLLVGTVCERKGQHDLARALAHVPRNVALRVRALFVGDRAGPYSRALADLIAALPEDRRRRATIVPETGAVAPYFVAADVFVCTSRVESYPRVILEAMAHGLPIVTTPVFGVREQVREDVNGIFYEPGDVAGLAAAIARIAGDDALRARLAAAAVPVLDSLTDFDGMVEQYGRIFVEAAAP